MKIDENQIIHGNVNVLVQVVNNMISNAIQAYDGKHDQNIQLEISKDSGNVIFSVTDFAGGLPKEVQNRLFKEMVTTKRKKWYRTWIIYVLFKSQSTFWWRYYI